MDAVLGPDKDKLPSYDDLANLKYSLSTFLETLRLHANVALDLKLPAIEATLPGTGTKVYPGQRLAYNIYGMGRSPRIWGPDAMEFKPERWIDESGRIRNESAFKFPVFNAGPRICLGMDSELDNEVVISRPPIAHQVFSESGQTRGGRLDGRDLPQIQA